MIINFLTFCSHNVTILHEIMIINFLTAVAVEQWRSQV